MKYFMLLFLLLTACAKHDDKKTLPELTETQCNQLAKDLTLSGHSLQSRTVILDDGIEYAVPDFCYERLK